MPDASALALPLLVTGFVLLLFGGDALVRGASGLARRLGMSEIVVGLTVVAFGTSMPELVVSVTAAATGENAISIGNVVGSNICNIGLILGFAALIRPMFAARGTVWKEIPFLLVASLVFTIMANDAVLGGGDAFAVLSRGDGLVLLVFFALFMYYIVQIVRTGPPLPDEPEDSPAPMPLGRASVWVAVGLVALVAGGHLVVTSAVDLAASIGMSERVIGLTVVAIGTSLPELATSAMAAYRRNADIAIGNVVGSNIFNTLLILGVSATVAPLPFPEGSNVDVAVMFVFTMLLLAVMFVGRLPYQIQRLEGALLMLGYAGYLGWLVAGR